MYRLTVGDVRVFFCVFAFPNWSFLSSIDLPVDAVSCIVLFAVHQVAKYTGISFVFKSCTFMPEDGRIDRNLWHC
jgi:hypothetical protein